jgi:glycosyltransferase involved in cell wall biosynthesis
MRILMVSRQLPIPASNGLAIRTLSVAQGLAAGNHAVTFVAPDLADKPSDLAPLSLWCREVSIVPRTAVSMSQGLDYLGRIRSLLSLRSYAVERYRSAAMRARIAAHLQREAFDLIVAEGLYAMVNLPDTAVPVVLNAHNAEYVIFQRYARLERSLARRWYARLEARWVKKTEKQVCERIALALVCSETDRGLLTALHPDLSAVVVPNAVDTDSFAPNEKSDSQPSHPVLLYLGGMDWYPNQDAVEYFASEILPLVRQQVPHVRFVVAGRNPPRHFTAKFAGVPGMEFTGTVPDMRPYISAATVVVVPLRVGGGTRIKILEASAAAKAVVATRVGAEGLDLAEGREIILADDPKEFGGAIVELLRDPQRRRLLGLAAREKIVQRYSQAGVRRSLDEVLRHITGSEARSVGCSAAGGTR